MPTATSLGTITGSSRRKASTRRKISSSGKVYYPSPFGGSNAPVSLLGLKDLIIRRGYSISSAAVCFDVSTARAESLLFSKKPAEAAITLALETYDKGFSFEIACVHAGVLPKIVRDKLAERQRHRQQHRNVYKY